MTKESITFVKIICPAQDHLFIDIEIMRNFNQLKPIKINIIVIWKINMFLYISDI